LGGLDSEMPRLVHFRLKKCLPNRKKSGILELIFNLFIHLPFMTSPSQKFQTLRVLVRLRQIRSFLKPGQFSPEQPFREINLLEKIQAELEGQLQTSQASKEPHFQNA
jgi:hypothetical protein